MFHPSLWHTLAKVAIFLSRFKNQMETPVLALKVALLTLSKAQELIDSGTYDVGPVKSLLAD